MILRRTRSAYALIHIRKSFCTAWGDLPAEGGVSATPAPTRGKAFSRHNPTFSIGVIAALWGCGFGLIAAGWPVE
jgi:hypothetical protein